MPPLHGLRSFLRTDLPGDETIYRTRATFEVMDDGTKI
jgi:hypothetical protein